jgi:hypothetical protein
VPVKTAFGQDLVLAITIPNFYKPGFGHQPGPMLTLFVCELTIGREHAAIPIVPANLLADKIICGDWPAVRRLNELGIRCCCAKGHPSKGDSGQEAPRGHHFEPPPKPLNLQTQNTYFQGPSL